MSMALSSFTTVTYSPDIEAEIACLAARIETLPQLNNRYQPRWLAIQLLEGDSSVLAGLPGEEKASLETTLKQCRQRLQDVYGADLDIAITDARYSYVHGLVAQVMTSTAQRLSSSDRIDQIVTHRWLGVPIFLGLMYLVFNLVQNVSAPYLDWVDTVISGPFTRWAIALLTLARAPEWLLSLVTDGVMAGVGGVLVFLPGLMVMYFALAVLEESGYMARAAFVMDRFMSVLGLHGKSFIPMILGFGCNVPAIYATRTIESRGARILTALLIPFMSCSARLPIYVVFGLALFPRHAHLVIWVLYVAGIVVAGLVGVALSRTLFKDAPPSILVMEMPAYHVPPLKRLLVYMWQQSSSFVRKAGTFILAGTIVFWCLLNLPWEVESTRDSYFGRASSVIAPVFTPAGFGDWRTGGALMTGLMAKEMVVATMAQIYVSEVEVAESEELTTFLADAWEIIGGFAAATIHAGQQLVEALTPGLSLFPEEQESKDTALTTALQQAFSPLTAFAFMLFVLLYVPCIATLGALTQELGWRWALLSMTIMLVIPWTLAVLVFQGGRLLGLA